MSQSDRHKENDVLSMMLNSVPFSDPKSLAPYRKKRFKAVNYLNAPEGAT
jgi:hypothetical protein